MEITCLSQTTIKVKGKQASVVIDPEKSVKTTADAVLFSSSDWSNSDANNIEGQRLIIHGPGEYEIGGIKIRAYPGIQHVVYALHIDNLDVLVCWACDIAKAQEAIKESQCVVIAADEKADASVIAKLSAQVVVFYGQQAVESAKRLGKESITPVAKYATTLEKLPAEMETVVLG